MVHFQFHLFPCYHPGYWLRSRVLENSQKQKNLKCNPLESRVIEVSLVIWKLASTGFHLVYSLYPPPFSLIYLGRLRPRNSNGDQKSARLLQTVGLIRFEHTSRLVCRCLRGGENDLAGGDPSSRFALSAWPATLRYHFRPTIFITRSPLHPLKHLWETPCP